MMKRGRIWIALALLLTVAVSFFLIRKPVMRFTATHIVEEDPLQKADAILVLAGEFPGRVLEAATLYKEGYAPLVILSRDEQSPEIETLREMGIGPDQAPSKNDVNRRVLGLAGVPEQNIRLLPNIITRTANEAPESLKYIRRLGGIQKLLVVTSRSHTRRAGKIFRKAYQGSGVEVRMRGDRKSGLDPNRWWAINLQRRAVAYEWMARVGALFLSAKD